MRFVSPHALRQVVLLCETPLHLLHVFGGRGAAIQKT